MTTTPASEYCSHGSSYAQKCRCDGCLARRARYQRDWRLAVAKRAHGVELPTDSRDPQYACKALWHARNVLDLTWREISRATQINLNTITRIYEQDVKWIRRATEKSILDIYGPDGSARRSLLPRTLVPYEGYQWMVEGLFAQGVDAGYPYGDSCDAR